MSTAPLKKTFSTVGAFLVVLVLVALPLAGGAAGGAEAAGGVKKFTILHTNDEHSEIIPYDVASDYPGNPTTGGFSRLAKTITDIKTAKAAAGEPVLTLGAGDWSQGTLFSWLETVTAPELLLMQQMGYDALAIGNHDVELGPAYTAAVFNAARGGGVNIPMLSSNIIFSGYPPDPASPDAALYTFYSETDKKRSDLFLQPYTTKTLSNGLKVGIFSLLGVEAEQVAPGCVPLNFGNVPGDNLASFVNRIWKAEEMVKLLRETKGCDVVVCLSHMGTEEEKMLTAFVPTIDVIVGGHSHDLNYPPFTWGTGGTILVQAKAYSEYLGKLELQYNAAAKGPKVTVRNGQAIHMDETVGTSPAIDAVVNGFINGLNAQLGFNILEKYAETDFKGDGGFPLMDTPAQTETNLGDLITDCYWGAVNGIDPKHPVDFAMEANGVIRAGVVKGASGSFSFYDLYRALPLGGSPYDPNVPGYPLASFYLYGSEIERVMNMLLDLNRNDFFLQASGLDFTYDPNASAGKKLMKLEVRNRSGGFGPIQPRKLYHLAANYYVGSFLGMFNLFPRDATGAQHKPPAFPDPMKEFIVHPAPGVELKSWQALIGGVGSMPDLDSDGLPNVMPEFYPVQDRITRFESTFYFAEGTCRNGYDPYLAIQNTGAGDASVRITYMKGDGKQKTQNIMVPAGSRGTVHPPDVLGGGDDPAHDFSAKVECVNGQQIVVERPIYFNFDGAWGGGNDAMGPTSPATSFYFAEGTCRPGFDPYLTIQNTGEEDANVTVTYMKGDGSNDSQTLTVPAESRATVVVKDKLGEGDDPSHDFSAKVECTNGQKIVVERPMYFDYKGLWSGGSVSVGATSASRVFYFAEGSCRPGFESYFTVMNPGQRDSAVKITYMLGDGRLETQELTVKKQSRETVIVRDKLGVGDDASHDFSAVLETTNNVPIVAERPVYFDYQGKWCGGHDVLGADTPRTLFFFAEGTCRPGFDAYLAIMNPSGSDASVKITYSLGDGSVKTQELMVPAHSRVTAHPSDVIGVGDGANFDFSALVESVNGMPIIAERPMYYDYDGLEGGSCVIGY